MSTSETIYRITLEDFNCALSTALGTTDLTDAQFERVLALVRRDIELVSGEPDGWNHYFCTLVKEAARLVLAPRLFDEEDDKGDD